MGLDASSAVVLGASLEAKTRAVNLIKYDPDTGVPYEKAGIQTYWVFRGTDIEVDIRANDDWIHYCDLDDENSYFLGGVIAQTDSHNRGHRNGKFTSELWSPIPSVTPEQQQHVADKLSSLGFTEQPRLFLLQRLSY